MNTQTIFDLASAAARAITVTSNNDCATLNIDGDILAEEWKNHLHYDIIMEQATEFLDHTPTIVDLSLNDTPIVFFLAHVFLKMDAMYQPGMAGCAVQ